MAKARRKSNEELETRLAALEALVAQVTPYEVGTWNANSSNFTGTATNFSSVTGNYVRIGNAVFCWGNGDITFSGDGNYTFDLILPLSAPSTPTNALSGTFDRTASAIQVAGSISGVDTSGTVTHARFNGNNASGAGTRGTSYMFSFRIGA